jgi:chromosome segregation ATPase
MGSDEKKETAAEALDRLVHLRWAEDSREFTEQMTIIREALAERDALKQEIGVVTEDRNGLMQMNERHRSEIQSWEQSHKELLTECLAIQAERDALKARIEGSPKMWIFSTVGNPADKQIEVYAVPVSDEEKEDAAK